MDNHFAKKSLGQNFLISPAPIRLMVKEARIAASDTVLEIGPGKGILTKALLETGAKVIAVEKDDSLIPVLQETFARVIKSGQLNLIHGDILELNLSTLNLSLSTSYKLVANIPYYITGEIIRTFLEIDNQPTAMALLVQKEVAERIVAKNPPRKNQAESGRESILSISVKVYGDPKYLGTVKRGLFRPMPNVDSAVLLIDNISKNNLNGIDEKRFFEIVKKGFAHKRKKLISNLEDVAGKEEIKKAFEKIGLGDNTRAEELSLESWLLLTRIL